MEGRTGAGRRHHLPAVLDNAAAQPLCAMLRDARGAALVLDGQEVTRLGGLCLQVLLAAEAAWRADGEVLALESRSDAMGAALALMGADGLMPNTQGGGV